MVDEDASDPVSIAIANLSVKKVTVVRSRMKDNRPHSGNLRIDFSDNSFLVVHKERGKITTHINGMPIFDDDDTD